MWRPALRQAVAAWLARYRGISVDPVEVIVVAGVSQALGLLAQALSATGVDRIAVEDPGSLGVRQHLNNWRVDTRRSAWTTPGCGSTSWPPAAYRP
ncbi:aminotransferase class I/II-fold pyridoxal phosphate-dependent enzyme [Micromonospora sp. M12]